MLQGTDKLIDSFEQLSDPTLIQDPYLPSIPEELLKDTKDWKNIKDIVKITFKALTDVVKT